MQACDFLVHPICMTQSVLLYHCCREWPVGVLVVTQQPCCMSSAACRMSAFVFFPQQVLSAQETGSCVTGARAGAMTDGSTFHSLP